MLAMSVCGQKKKWGYQLQFLPTSYYVPKPRCTFALQSIIYCTRLLCWTSTRQGAGIITVDDRFRPVFPERRIAGLRPANPERRSAHLWRPKDRLRLALAEQRIAGLLPANPRRRFSAVYCCCINGVVLAYLAAGGAPPPPPPHYKTAPLDLNTAIGKLLELLALMTAFGGLKKTAFGRYLQSNKSQAFDGLQTPRNALPAFGGMNTAFGRYSPSNASQAYGLQTPSDALPAFSGLKKTT